MKKRLMANLRGDDDPKNTIVSEAERRSFTPDLIVAGNSSPLSGCSTPDLVPTPPPPPPPYKPQSPLVGSPLPPQLIGSITPPMPPPPPQPPSLMRQPPPPMYDLPRPQRQISVTSPLATKSLAASDFEKSMNEQLDGLTECLHNVSLSKSGSNNSNSSLNNMPYVPMNPSVGTPSDTGSSGRGSPVVAPQAAFVRQNSQANRSPQPFTPSSAPQAWKTVSPVSTPTYSMPPPPPQPTAMAQQQYFGTPPPRKVDLIESKSIIRLIVPKKCVYILEFED